MERPAKNLNALKTAAARKKQQRMTLKKPAATNAARDQQAVVSKEPETMDSEFTLADLPITTKIVTFERFSGFSATVPSRDEMISSSLSVLSNANDYVDQALSAYAELSALEFEARERVAGDMSAVVSAKNYADEALAGYQPVSEMSAYAKSAALDAERQNRISADEWVLSSAKKYADEHLIDGDDFVPLSGDETITGDLTMDECDLKHREMKTVTWKNLEMENDGEYRYSGNITFSYPAENAQDLLSLTMKDIHTRVSGVLISSGETETFDCLLKDPEYYEYYQEFAVMWRLFRDGDDVGNIIFFKSSETNLPQTHSAMFYKDYCLLGRYLEDTVSETEFVKNYIYDLNGLEDEVAKIRAEITTGMGYRLMNYTCSEGTLELNVKNKTMAGVAASQAVAGVNINIPAPTPGALTDFIVDVNNRKDSDLIVNIIADKFTWKIAIDDGASFGDFISVPAGGMARYKFMQTGFTANETRDGENIEVPVIHVTKTGMSVR